MTYKKAGRFLPDKYFKKSSLRKGTKIEMEHTKRRYIAKRIAKDHLAEHPKYYDYLETMENKIKKRRY